MLTDERRMGDNEGHQRGEHCRGKLKIHCDHTRKKREQMAVRER
jgi:hypothetical protein